MQWCKQSKSLNQRKRQLPSFHLPPHWSRVRWASRVVGVISCSREPKQKVQAVLWVLLALRGVCLCLCVCLAGWRQQMAKSGSLLTEEVSAEVTEEALCPRPQVKDLGCRAGTRSVNMWRGITGQGTWHLDGNSFRDCSVLAACPVWCGEAASPTKACQVKPCNHYGQAQKTTNRTLITNETQLPVLLKHLLCIFICFQFPWFCIYYFFIQIYMCIFSQCLFWTYSILFYICFVTQHCFFNSSILVNVATLIHFYCYTIIHWFTMWMWYNLSILCWWTIELCRFLLL